MNRREFLTRSWKKASETDSELSWIRPPFARSEADFLEKCTSCGDCVAACPHDVIFSLSAAAGPRAKDTPAMDLLHKGCHLCEGWPCVAACEPGALVIEETDEASAASVLAPVLAVARVDTSTCIAYLGPECGACAHVCPIEGALEWHDVTLPHINREACVGCGLCREACIVSPKAIMITLPATLPA